MDFSDLIKISRVDNVILHRPFEGPMQKALGITGHHLILSSLNEKVEEITSKVNQSRDNTRVFGACEK